MIPNGSPELIWALHPEFRATAQCHSMMIEHRRDDQRPIEDSRDQDGVLELRQLIAESAVGSIPEESLARKV